MVTKKWVLMNQKRLMMEVRMKMIVVHQIPTVTVKVVIQNQVPQVPVNMKAALKTKVLDNLVKVQN